MTYDFIVEADEIKGDAKGFQKSSNASSLSEGCPVSLLISRLPHSCADKSVLPIHNQSYNISGACHARAKAIRLDTGGWE